MATGREGGSFTSGGSGDAKGATNSGSSTLGTATNGQPLVTPDTYNKDTLVKQIGAVTQNGLNNGYAVNPELQYAGLGATTTGALNSLGNAATGNAAGLTAANNFNTGIINNAQNPSLTEQTLMGVAKGNDLGTNNPYFEAQLQKTLGDQAANVNAAYSANGRFGSNVAAGALADSIGNTSNTARYAEYQNQQNRQLQALSAIEGTRQQGVTNGMNAANASGQLYQNTLQPFQTALSIGQASDADRQAALTARDQLFRQQNDANYTNAQRYLGLISGTPAQTQQSNGLLDALGVAGSLASIFL